jgi:hypothetical protein
VLKNIAKECHLQLHHQERQICEEESMCKKEPAGEFDRDCERLFTLILFVKSAACFSSNEGLKMQSLTPPLQPLLKTNQNPLKPLSRL